MLHLTQGMGKTTRGHHNPDIPCSDEVMLTPLTCFVIHRNVMVGSSHSTSTEARHEDRSRDHSDKDPGVLVDRPTRDKEVGTAAETTPCAGMLPGVGNTCERGKGEGSNGVSAVL
jgi:hypothetical protein